MAVPFCVILHIFFLFIAMFSFSKSEVFLALTHMTDIVRMEQTFGSYLEEYLHHNPAAPTDLRRLATDVKLHVQSVKDDDIEAFLGHPVNAFLLVWRFLTEWGNVANKLDETNPIGLAFYDQLTEQHTANTCIIARYKLLVNTERLQGSAGYQLFLELRELIKEHNMSFPSEQDLRGCAQAILRIQDVYHISAEKIANGKLSDSIVSPELRTVHCLELGHINDHWGHHEEAYGWFTEAWRRLSPLDRSNGMKNKDVLQYLIWTEYKTGRFGSALNHTNLILEEDPNDEEAQQNKAYYESRLSMMEEEGEEEEEAEEEGEEEEEREMAEEEEDEEKTSKETEKPKPKQEFILHYERLCRGESNKSQAELDKLTCYHYNKHPLLVIKPVKIEIASLNPYIYLLHDVIRDEDIEFIKELAAPRLERATVTNRNTGSLEFADYRISKSGWLDDEEGEPIMRLNRRLEAITGLSTASFHSETLQVVNYGIAGHYEPHVDHAGSKNSAIFQMGMRNRIATVLIYMTDVEAGGSTVFLDAETVIEPQKGTAAFWFNLLKSGESDGSTRHAGCPVIVGSKWVSNKWIHENGQEFRRPCGLSPDE